MAWLCPECGFAVRRKPKGKFVCKCGFIVHKDGTTGRSLQYVELLDNCPHLGDVVDEIPAKQCGCGVNKPLPVHHCNLHDAETTRRKVPRVRVRRERNCWDCITAKENVADT